MNENKEVSTAIEPKEVSSAIESKEVSSTTESKEVVTALVLARGGSKGIPGKNLAMLGQQTLLGRCLDTLAAAECEYVGWTQ